MGLAPERADGQVQGPAHGDGRQAEWPVQVEQDGANVDGGKDRTDDVLETRRPQP